MSDKEVLPEVKPEIVFIYDVIHNIEEGELRIPKFQRPFVWCREQMVDLLDSIRSQYPIGSILVWETDTPINSEESVGFIRIHKKVKGTVSYILDGQQRLSTLFGTLRKPTPDDDAVQDPIDPERWKIWFNAREDRFEHLKPGQVEACHFPLSMLLDTLSFLKESQRMLQEGGTEGERYVNKVQSLSRTFQSYKLPIIRIRTELNKAVEIFYRLNNRGQTITPDQMVSALTYREPGSSEQEEDFNLAKEIDEIQDELFQLNYSGINRVFILRVFMASIGESVYMPNWKSLSQQERVGNRRQKFQEASEKVKTTLPRVVEFLKEMGVHCDRLLPYSMQLVVLSAFFLACSEPTTAQIDLLRRWFWVTSFSGWFASGNPSRIEALIKEFREALARENHPLSIENMDLEERAIPFPDRYDMRSARTRTLLLVMLAQKPLDEQGEPIPDPWKQIEADGPHAMGNICATVRDKALASSPANRILRISTDNPKREQAKNWLIRLQGMDEARRNEILLSHAIPPAAFEDLVQGRHEDFLSKRQEFLIDLEIKFMQEQGVNPSEKRSPAPAPLDNDE